MIQEDLNDKILFFISIWCVATIAFLLILDYVQRVFISKHPELLKQNCNPHVKRRYQKIIMFNFMFIGIWMVFVLLGVQWFLKQFSVIPILIPIIGIGLVLFKMNKRT